MRMTAIYARVSSEQQREENTIASQTAALVEFRNAFKSSEPTRPSPPPHRCWAANSDPNKLFELAA